MMLKEATKEELALLNVSRPDINADQSGWRLSIENTAENIQNRIEITLRKNEEKCGLSNGSKKDIRKMTVTGVENRLKEIKKIEMQSSQKSMKNFTVHNKCNTSTQHPKTPLSSVSKNNRKSPPSALPPSSTSSSKRSKHCSSW
jgi:hypothetical protein